MNRFPSNKIPSIINKGIKPPHLIDDYILSRNIARYGLKFETMMNLQKKLADQGNYFWHEYTIPTEQKIIRIKQTIKDWNIVNLLPAELQKQFQEIKITEQKEQPK